MIHIVKGLDIVNKAEIDVFLELTCFSDDPFGTGLKTDIFQCCCHCWIFQICWYTECSTLIASLFRILNSLAEMPSPLLVFIVFIVMLHTLRSLTPWVSTSSFLSRSLRSFLYSFSIYSCHLFLISFTSIRSILFLIFILPILAQNVPLISRVILKRSLVYPSYFFPLYFFALFL